MINYYLSWQHLFILSSYGYDYIDAAKTKTLFKESFIFNASFCALVTHYQTETSSTGGSKGNGVS